MLLTLRRLLNDFLCTSNSRASFAFPQKQLSKHLALETNSLPLAYKADELRHIGQRPFRH